MTDYPQELRQVCDVCGIAPKDGEAMNMSSGRMWHPKCAPLDRELPHTDYPCERCGHSSDDHHMRHGDDPTLVTTEFKCVVPTCTCPDMVDKIGSDK